RSSAGRTTAEDRSAEARARWRRARSASRSRGRSSDDPADAALLERPGHDHPLDLRGALPDPVHAELAEIPLGWELAHVAAPPEHLDDPIGAAPGSLRREELGERRLGVDDLRIRARIG